MESMVFNTAVSMSKREIVSHGIQGMLDVGIDALRDTSQEGFLNLVCSDLRNENNLYQFILTINKLENNDND
jgi:hypothetical protein